MLKFSVQSKLSYGLVALLMVAGSFLIGYGFGNKNLVLSQNYQPKIVKTEIGKPKDVDFSLFWKTWERVNEKYAGDIDNQQMLYDAISGALYSLKDPYTLFLPPDEAKRFDEDLKGSFDGIGAEIEKRDGSLTIVAPLEGSPAETAGLLAKDVILEIDGQEAIDMGLEEAIDKIRGKKGTVVKLIVYRAEATAPLEINITRDTIVVKPVKWERKANDIGYIKLNMFGEETVKLTEQAIAELTRQPLKGMIIDLRNNPGGFLESSVDIASLFLKERGAIVKEKNKKGQVSTIDATLPAVLTDIPLIVLVNGGSASASEIMAGALQDYGRAKLVGEKTFGKGSVQELERLKDGSALRVTIAKWLTPKDRQINDEGILPDIEVVPSDEQVKNKQDIQLERALAELTKP